MSLGPVQVLVFGFEAADFTGEALAELARLSDAGIVRLVDVMLVRRGDDDAIETLPTPAGFDPELGRIAARLLAGSEAAPVAVDAPGAPGTWSLSDAIPVGGMAAVALIEHVWAGPLLAAIHRSGGVPLEEAWLDADDHAMLEGLLAR